MAETTITPKLFGTDGIRAPFGEYPLDETTVVRVGHSLAETLGETTPAPLVLLGGDTRDSTETICRWLSRGLAAADARVLYLGVVPTPAVAYLVRHLAAQGGVAVSASHNPHPDNGIKLFDAAGHKWAPAAEAALEGRLDGPPPAAPPHADELEPDAAARAAYREALVASAGGEGALAGLTVALDTAHGATWELAPDVFAALGARVHLFGAAPDGRNINRECGSTHPDPLAAEVARLGAHLGVAFDGDGDRAILVDEQGRVRDGDAMLYLWATALASEDALTPRQVVATTMSNLGLEHALAVAGIGVVRCDVGDRVVMETMLRQGIELGGEQSGHVVHRSLSTTGDGILTALQLARVVVRRGAPLSRLLAGFRRFPQVLRNVRVREKRPFAELAEVSAAARRIEEALRAQGRMVLRYSGTEPLARIMLEGPDQGALERHAEALAAAIEEALG
ncbi:MAG TPA: phosphoglucosamine mutase [Thermoanaerobaculia bacterium]|nr:phosphoglucosamine mutase [Thermoanaerobaculia bacterium]